MAGTSSAVTPTALTREAGTVITAVAFTETSANETETLVITPSLAGSRLILIINEVSGDSGTMTVDCAAGDYWAGEALSTVSVAQATDVVLCFEPAMHQDKDDDTITVVITPASGKKVWTDHDATYQCFELPL